MYIYINIVWYRGNNLNIPNSMIYCHLDSLGGPKILYEGYNELYMSSKADDDSDGGDGGSTIDGSGGDDDVVVFEIISAIS